MQEERDDNGQALADAMSHVREFVVQQLQAGTRADKLFALALIPTQLDLHVTQGRNRLGVIRTALQGALAAADGSKARLRQIPELPWATRSTSCPRAQ